MAEQELIKVAREIVEGFNADDWPRMKAPLAADCVYNEFGTRRRVQGADQVVEAWQGWKQAFPDVKGTVTNAFASGNSVALQITWEGTHNGPLVTPGGTIAATGKRQRTPTALLVTFQGEKVKESHHYFDLLGLLQQIGAA